MQRLIGQVDFIVTDSPSLISLSYLKAPDPVFTKEVIDTFKRQNNFNIFIERGQRFEQEGRIHNLEESKKIDKEIKSILAGYGIYFGTYRHATVDISIANMIHTLERTSIGFERDKELNKMLERLTEQELSDVSMVLESSFKLAFRAIEYTMRKDMGKAKKAAQDFQKAAPQIFKGNIYDMSYFWGYKNLPFSVLDSLPKDICKAVKQNFDGLMQQGYVQAKDKAVVLTGKGEQLINNPEFIRAAIQDRSNGLGDIKKVVEQEYNRRIAQLGESQANAPAINYQDGLVNNTNELIAEAGKRSGSIGMGHTAQAGSVAVQQGVGEAAKAGAKVGTGTATTAAGAATMGAATAAQIGYELAQGSIKILQDKIHS